MVGVSPVRGRFIKDSLIMMRCMVKGVFIGLMVGSMKGSLIVVRKLGLVDIFGLMDKYMKENSKKMSVMVKENCITRMVKGLWVSGGMVTSMAKVSGFILMAVLSN